jgi:MFS family permease
MMYVHVESLAGLFVASYFYLVRQITYSEAALFTMAYFLALTIGRFLSGLLSNKLKPQTLIYIGEALMIASMILIYLPINNLIYYYFVVGILGIGSGPVFPNMMYLNPHIFDKNKTSRIMSLQMAIGYLGFGVLTPLAGLLFQEITIDLYPIISLAASITLLVITIKYLRLSISKP